MVPLLFNCLFTIVLFGFGVSIGNPPARKGIKCYEQKISKSKKGITQRPEGSASFVYCTYDSAGPITNQGGSRCPPDLIYYPYKGGSCVPLQMFIQALKRQNQQAAQTPYQGGANKGAVKRDLPLLDPGTIDVLNLLASSPLAGLQIALPGDAEGTVDEAAVVSALLSGPNQVAVKELPYEGVVQSAPLVTTNFYPTGTLGAAVPPVGGVIPPGGPLAPGAGPIPPGGLFPPGGGLIPPGGGFPPLGAGLPFPPLPPPYPPKPVYGKHDPDEYYKPKYQHKGIKHNKYRPPSYLPPPPYPGYAPFPPPPPPYYNKPPSYYGKHAPPEKVKEDDYEYQRPYYPPVYNLYGGPPPYYNDYEDGHDDKNDDSEYQNNVDTGSHSSTPEPSNNDEAWA